MNLNDIATAQDKAFWAYANKHNVRNAETHQEGFAAGLKASDGLPPHRKPNAFKAAYNSILRVKLDELGWSWSDHIAAKKEGREALQRKPKKAPSAKLFEPSKKVYTPPNTGDGFYDSVDMSQLKL